MGGRNVNGNWKFIRCISGQFYLKRQYRNAKTKSMDKTKRQTKNNMKLTQEDIVRPRLLSMSSPACDTHRENIQSGIL